MAEKALVIGSGFLGTHIIDILKNNGINTVGTHFNLNNDGIMKVDVRNINSINDCVAKIKPDLIINCAAITQLDFLEKNPQLAFSVNADGAKNVATVSKRNKIRLVHISTDGVFDGKRGMYSEEDIPNPINVYAKSKAEGEKLVRENSDNHVIIRTNFYGFDKNDRFLFNWILNMLKQHKQIVGFSDVIFTPLEVSNLSEMIKEISMKSYCGIIHLASDEILSKYQFALRIAEIFELNKDLIKEGSVDDYKDFVAKRPKNTSLINKKARQLMKTPIISLSEWLMTMKSKIDVLDVKEFKLH